MTDLMGHLADRDTEHCLDYHEELPLVQQEMEADNIHDQASLARIREGNRLLEKAYEDED